jgi:Right handed beta helix region
MKTLTMQERITRPLQSSGKAKSRGAFRLAWTALIVLLVVISLPASAHAATFCSDGTVTGNMTLGAGVYTVTNCKLTAGSTLTLNPGVIIKMSGVFKVRGKLIASGQASNPVVFTSYRDDSYGGDTNGDGPSSGAPGDWNSIVMKKDGVVNLDYAVVKYGGANSSPGMIQSMGDSTHRAKKLLVTNSTIADGKRRGIDVRNLQKKVHVANTQFLDNGETGLNVFVDGQPIVAQVTDNTFQGNGQKPTVTGDETLKYAAAFVTSSTAPVTSSWTISNNQGSNNGINAMYIENYISGAQTLGSNSLPYVSGGIVVLAGGTLNLDPGVVMKFNYRTGNLHDVDTSFVVSGQINLNGTAAQPIILTSYYDDAYGGDTDGTTTAPQPGDWHKIWLQPGGSGTITYATLRYGGGDKLDCSQYGCTPANIVANGNSLTVSNSTVAESKVSAIQVLSGSTTISNSQFNDNAWNALDLRGYGPPNLNAQISNNTFSNNGRGNGITDETRQYPIYVYTLASTVAQFSGNQLGAKANSYNGLYVDGSGGFKSLDLGANPGLAFVTDYTKVLAGKLLQLDPGAVVKFRYSTSHLNVLGTLDAYGASGNPVIFTSFADDTYAGDTNGDGPSAGSPRSWDNLMYFSGGTINFDYTSILWGGSGGHGCVVYNGGTLNKTSHTVINCP